MRATAALLSLVLAAGPVQALTVLIYARADAPQADRVRRLSAAFDRVWLDRDLVPGTPWRPEIGRRICQADRVLVLWSAYAAASVEVGAEWRVAAGCGRRVVPVLLDAAPLPPELGMRQAVDWRAVP